ncbi:hypothetical protein ANTRET_LOCUS8792 [Anthophora retusa]
MGEKKERASFLSSNIFVVNRETVHRGEGRGRISNLKQTFDERTKERELDGSYDVEREDVTLCRFGIDPKRQFVRILKRRNTNQGLWYPEKMKKKLDRFGSSVKSRTFRDVVTKLRALQLQTPNSPYDPALFRKPQSLYSRDDRATRFCGTSAPTEDSTPKLHFLRPRGEGRWEFP